MSSLSTKELRQLTYVELKQYAKKQGVKRTNMKADKLISAILSANARPGPDETLNRCDEGIDNSLLDENESWSEDSEIELKTPLLLKRSSTFSVDTPIIPVDQTCLTPAKLPNKSILRHGKKDMLVKNGKFSGNKVNFITPDRRLLRRSSSSSEIHLRSVKNRPKTPVVRKGSVKRKHVPSPLPEKSSKYGKTVNGQSTPRSSNSIAGETKMVLDKSLQAGTPVAKSAERKPVGTASRICSANFTKIHQKAFDRMESIEDYQERLHNRMTTLTRSKKKSAKEVTSSVKGNAQRNQTPEKLSYSKSEQVYLKSSRIPQPSKGMPFIPAVKSIRKIDTNFAGRAQSQNLDNSTPKCCAENENPSRRCQRSLFTAGSEDTVFWFGKDHLQENSSSVAGDKRSQKKFDLKASLAKKLPYKPYRGVLRPLSDSNANQSCLNASFLDPIKKKREQSREILKGVRKNHRFELQLKFRGIS